MYQKALKIKHKEMKLYSVKRSVKKNMEAAVKKSEPVKEQILSDNEAITLNGPDELNIILNLDKNNLIQGLIMSEVLGHPRAIKSRGNTVWNSRF